MVEYGVPAGKASTVVARSQAVRGWGTAWPSHISVYSSWAPASLAASPVPQTLALEARVYVIWGVFCLDEVW